MKRCGIVWWHTEQSTLTDGLQRRRETKGAIRHCKQPCCSPAAEQLLTASPPQCSSIQRGGLLQDTTFCWSLPRRLLEKGSRCMHFSRVCQHTQHLTFHCWAFRHKLHVTSMGRWHPVMTTFALWRSPERTGKCCLCVWMMGAGGGWWAASATDCTERNGGAAEKTQEGATKKLLCTWRFHLWGEQGVKTHLRGRGSKAIESHHKFYKYLTLWRFDKKNVLKKCFLFPKTVVPNPRGYWQRVKKHDLHFLRFISNLIPKGVLLWRQPRN